MGKAINAADGITGSQIKWIALTAMLIDHIALTIVLDSALTSTESTGRHIEILYYTLKLIGRLAFPLFCFLLVEGFLHTHSRRAYFRNLVVFALVSEIPFDLANSDRIWIFTSKMCSLPFRLECWRSGSWSIFKGRNLNNSSVFWDVLRLQFVWLRITASLELF